MEMICIRCPLGCRLNAEEGKDGQISVQGNLCARGREYAQSEMVNPMRTVTATVKITGAHIGRLSVKTNAPVPKNAVFDILKILKGITVKAPVGCGDVIVSNVLDTGADVVATGNLEEAY